MLDPIAEMLTNIRNAVAARHKEVILPKSALKLRLCEILKEQGYIENVETINDGPQGHMKISLKYADEARTQGPIHEIKMISRPGQRIYVKNDRVPRIKQGLGISVVSTSQGLMVGHEARKRKLGGELIFQVW